jgi:hypothetical protein
MLLKKETIKKKKKNQTDRQTGRQTNECPQKHNLLGRGKY